MTNMPSAGPLSDDLARPLKVPEPRRGNGSQLRLVGARRPAADPGTTDDRPTADLALRRQQIRHDISHELGTIMLLATLLSTAPDVGATSRERAEQILGEARWLDQLQREYESAADLSASGIGGSLVRIDVVAADVLSALQLSCHTRGGFTSAEAWAPVDRLALWRTLRNVMGNAFRAAGPDGQVDVCVGTEAGWAVVQIDDDGPGFGGAAPGRASLGLGIVRDFASDWGGDVQIRRSSLGGCCVRLRVPAVAPPPGRNCDQ